MNCSAVLSERQILVNLRFVFGSRQSSGGVWSRRLSAIFKASVI